MRVTVQFFLMLIQNQVQSPVNGGGWRRGGGGEWGIEDNPKIFFFLFLNENVTVLMMGRNIRFKGV